MLYIIYNAIDCNRGAKAETMEIVKSKNRSYARYEEVLIERDSVRRDAEGYYVEYVRVFGGLIREAFEARIGCIRKKKMITCCQRQINQGKKIDYSNLVAYIEAQMTEYQAELDKIIEENAAAKSAKKVSPENLHRIKRIYYELVKLVHPDLHPDLAEDETIKGYWQRIMIAYICNNLKDMEELEVLVKQYLSDGEIELEDIEVRDVEDKIAEVEEEIKTIRDSEPYVYRYILEEPATVGDTGRSGVCRGAYP